MALDYKSGLARYRRYLQVASERPLWRASAFVIFSLTLVITLVLSALRPTLITIAGLLGQINKEQDVVNQLNQKIQTVQQAVQALDNQRHRLSILDGAYPNESSWTSWSQMITTSQEDMC
jgi:ABC-type Fe3+-hydroxamate transport system substrate-binding protein